jgi:hypothetical protein
MKFIERGRRRVTREIDLVCIGSVAHAVGIFGIRCHIGSVVEPFEYKGLPGKRWEPMEQFDCFLHLNSGDDGGGRRSGRRLALQHLVAR